ncbi:hypothetical protein HNQ50_004102 [Silvimonas terrae]|uniref:DUF5672 domain-containing protein n=1 Tax=Silvimonas terrae TaxID=300266 RepID=A0A840RLE5_9NEIS|nr:DUF5672 family protein [Silvimonas terrae]MBB5193348.1 hypothetical protein [Silvimonas terrae]
MDKKEDIAKKRKSDFSRITLVSVTGLEDAQHAAYALVLSQQQMPGARALLCSPKAPEYLPPTIEHKVIAKLGYTEYSLFMMFALWHLIETEFALIIQDDGWVLDGANWRDEYFDYDYVGAPVAHGRVDTPAGTRWMSKFDWYAHLGKPDHTVYPVLNGGFSLRSKRMLRALIDHPEIKVHIPRPDILHFDPFRMYWRNCAPNEDVQLTATLRPELENAGIKYPPLDICTLFAAEDTGPMYKELDFKKLLGHHGPWRRLVSIDPPTVQYRMKRSLVKRARRELDMVQMFEDRGYSIVFTPE